MTECPDETKNWKNKIQCILCSDIIESTHVHDFVRCKCGKVFLDGGNDYQRIGGDLDNIKYIWEERG